MFEIKQLQRELLEGLRSIGFLRSSDEGLDLRADANKHCSSSRVVNAALVAGLYPQVGGHTKKLFILLQFT